MTQQQTKEDNSWPVRLGISLTLSTPAASTLFLTLALSAVAVVEVPSALLTTADDPPQTHPTEFSARARYLLDPSPDTLH